MDVCRCGPARGADRERGRARAWVARTSNDWRSPPQTVAVCPADGVRTADGRADGMWIVSAARRGGTSDMPVLDTSADRQLFAICSHNAHIRQMRLTEHL